MSADACARWASLADRLALEESLAPADAAFLRRHAGTCDACREEARVYMELEGLLAPETAMPREGVAMRPHARAKRIAAATVATLAMAAGIAWIVQARQKAPLAVTRTAPAVTPAPTVTEALTPATTATVTLLEGDATIDAARAAAGAPLADGVTLATGNGRACLQLDAGVHVCLAASTHVRVVSLGGPARVLRLESGRVAAELEPQAPGTSFTIAAGAGSVTAIGTAFSVELADGALPFARVEHGVVLVRAKDETRVRAHESIRFGEVVHALPSADEDADRALLRDTSAPQTKEPARFTLETSPPGANVRIDDAPVGATPLDVLVAPGAHHVTIEGVPAPIATELRPGEHFAKEWILAPVPLAAAPAVASPPTPASSPAPVSSAGDLLVAAQAARAHGDANAAARAYRALLASHPASPEAAAATLSLAEIELAQGAADASLVLFDRYLAAGGPLALEARYGKVRALARLGRAEEAKVATDAFLRDYPGTPQAEALRTKRAP